MSVAARAFRVHQVDRGENLRGRRPPVWCFVNLPMNDASSTEIRAKGRVDGRGDPEGCSSCAFVFSSRASDECTKCIEEGVSQHLAHPDVAGRRRYRRAMSSPAHGVAVKRDRLGQRRVGVELQPTGSPCARASSSINPTSAAGRGPGRGQLAWTQSRLTSAVVRIQRAKRDAGQPEGRRTRQ